jgi:hypothetical protein
MTSPSAKTGDDVGALFGAVSSRTERRETTMLPRGDPS